MSWFEFGAEIVAVEDSDATGWLESATTIGDVTFRSLEGFVEAVLSELGDRKLALLHIQVHGNPDGLGFGRDWVSTSTFDTYRASFQRLASKFTHNAWIDLRACNVGENLPLMHRFRKFWGVGVVAGRGEQNNLYDMNFGLYQIVERNGKETLSFSAPPWVAYDVGRRAERSITSRL